MSGDDIPQIIFIHIPKTAGYAIGHCLSDLKILKPGYGFTHNIAMKIKHDERDGIIMSVVRNPYDRLYSIYEFHSKKRSDIKNETFRSFILKFETKYYLRSSQYNTCCIFLENEEGNFMTTDIIRFENLQTDYESFCLKYRIKNNLTEMNRNELKDTNIDWSKLYDKEMRTVVDKVFRKDFEAFNYSYDSFIADKTTL